MPTIPRDPRKLEQAIQELQWLTPADMPEHVQRLMLEARAVAHGNDLSDGTRDDLTALVAFGGLATLDGSVAHLSMAMTTAYHLGLARSGGTSTAAIQVMTWLIQQWSTTPHGREVLTWMAEDISHQIAVITEVGYDPPHSPPLALLIDMESLLAAGRITVMQRREGGEEK